MTLEKLTEATAAGFELWWEVLRDLLPSADVRVEALKVLAESLRGQPVWKRPAFCQHCGMPEAQMAWHPNDNRNLCPRCGVSRLGPVPAGSQVAQKLILPARPADVVSESLPSVAPPVLASDDDEGAKDGPVLPAGVVSVRGVTLAEFEEAAGGGMTKHE